MPVAPFPHRALAVLALTLAPLTSCSVHKMAKDVAHAGEEVAAEQASRPGPSPAGSAVSRVLEDPNVQQAASSMAREVARGGVAGMTEGVQRSTIIQNITPQLETAVQSAMTKAIQGTADAVASNPQAIERVSGIVAQSMGHGLSTALADPAPGGLTPAVGGLVRTASREAVVGMSEGMQTLEPMADPELRSKLYQTGLALGQGMGRGIPTGMAENRGFLLVLSGLLVAVSLVGGAALYALWKQNQATSRALLLLAQRLAPEGIAEPPPPPSRRPPPTRVPSPSLA